MYLFIYDVAAGVNLIDSLDTGYRRRLRPKGILHSTTSLGSPSKGSSCPNAVMRSDAAEGLYAQPSICKLFKMIVGQPLRPQQAAPPPLAQGRLKFGFCSSVAPLAQGRLKFDWQQGCALTQERFRFDWQQCRAPARGRL